MPLKIISHIVLYFYTIANKFIPVCTLKGASLVAQMVTNLPAMWETWVQSLGWKDPLEKGMATHSIFLAWRIPWTEELGGLHHPMVLQRAGHE